MRRPGIEPGPSAWKADILTTRPTTLLLIVKIRMLRLQNIMNHRPDEAKMTAVGFEPTPFRTSALSWRLRPLGHAVATA